MAQTAEKLAELIDPCEDDGAATAQPLGFGRRLHPAMLVKVDDGTITVERPSEENEHKALHGLTRTLIANMVEGVTKGFEKHLEIQGVGYRAALKGRDLELALGLQGLKLKGDVNLFDGAGTAYLEADAPIDLANPAPSEPK